MSGGGGRLKLDQFLRTSLPCPLPNLQFMKLDQSLRRSLPCPLPNLQFMKREQLLSRKHGLPV